MATGNDNNGSGAVADSTDFMALDGGRSSLLTSDTGINQPLNMQADGEFGGFVRCHESAGTHTT